MVQAQLGLPPVLALARPVLALARPLLLRLLPLLPLLVLFVLYQGRYSMQLSDVSVELHQYNLRVPRAWQVPGLPRVVQAQG